MPIDLRSAVKEPDKTYSNITLQEIIDEADIGRSTFYSHFETKDELLKALCTEIFNHVFSDELTSELTHDYSNSDKDTKDEITHIPTSRKNTCSITWSAILQRQYAGG